jgi:polyisoprenoid-binding protein YceI
MQKNKTIRTFSAFALSAAVVGAAALTVGNSVNAAQESAKTQAAAGGAFKVDPVHASVIFGIKHLKASNFYGRFNDISGSFLLDGSDKSMIDVSVKTASVDTGNSKRDDHIRSQDFFSAKEFPTFSFKSTSVKKTGENTFDVAGTLTVRGQSKPITVKVEKTGEGPGMAPGVTVAGFETRFSFKRSDFGMNKYIAEGALSDEVSLIVAIEGGR